VIGDRADIAARLRKLLPPWFDQEAIAPVVSAALNGAAAVFAGLYAIYVYAKAQTRIKSATDGFLDLIAGDFFGAALIRKAGQSDFFFRQRILANLFREKNTRKAVIQVLTDLTGQAPIIVEPWNLADTGAWDAAQGYDLAGYWGGEELPYQSFVVAFRPTGAISPDFGGWDVAESGWDAGIFYWADQFTGQVTDADIIAAVESVRMANTVIWLSIRGAAPGVGGLDFSIAPDSEYLPAL
jgi:hypothetical protein